ncbi:TLR adapter interacting with SLC15A4 on the lysosome [Trichomycterus rosablanca]|uniref:TLR adapter interacting with SLC15A4 on the lysosome n=1 Tax=Trichomycterus rosablanca TaxID=2290929 RepID=UPI002F353289
MLCESSLWWVAFCLESDCVDSPTCHSVMAPKFSHLTSKPSANTQAPVHFFHNSISRDSHSSDGESQISSTAPLDWRHLSPGMGIHGSVPSPVAEAFLVPSSCQSICQNYSDLHIAGGQVLPLSPGAGNVQSSFLLDQHTGPFLLSKDFPPSSLLRPQPPEHRSSRRWREVSGRERPSLLQDGRPLSNSELNGYLEKKLLELYTEYMTEDTIMASVLEQITLQLSQEHKLETARAKDMLLSCLMRVTSSHHSSEISTPVLQISTQTT